MLALFSMLLVTYYASNYVGIISLGLAKVHGPCCITDIAVITQYSTNSSSLYFLKRQNMDVVVVIAHTFNIALEISSY